MLRKKRFQNKVAGSRYALPISATLITLIWVAVGLMVGNIWVQFTFTIASTLLMVELNNRNSLMRIYSRMVSCSFLALLTAVALPSPTLKGAISTLCFIAFHLVIWNAYQNKRSAGWTFYAFFCIGLASMVFIQVFYYLPFLWLMMMVFTLSFSLRTFVASIIGIVSPYWFAAGFFIYNNNLQGLIDHLADFVNYSDLFDYSQITDHNIVNITFIAILAIIGMIHFLRNSYADKIRTRMIYESLIMIDVVSILFVILQPQHIYELQGIMVVNTAPLIAHYITFTHSRLSNICFVSILVLAAIILAYNIWLPPVCLF